jgi:transcriptional regulator with XRE-family HTH domain
MHQLASLKRVIHTFLAQERAARGWNQIKVAHLAAIPKTRVAEIETGKRHCRAEELLLLMMVYGLDGRWVDALILKGEKWHEEGSIRELSGSASVSFLPREPSSDGFPVSSEQSESSVPSAKRSKRRSGRSNGSKPEAKPKTNRRHAPRKGK